MDATQIIVFILMFITLTSIAWGKLKKKNRSLHWLWLALISAWIPLIISICLLPREKGNG